ncbi:unnamed protein product [Urochloa humidicola]
MAGKRPSSTQARGTGIQRTHQDKTAGKLKASTPQINKGAVAALMAKKASFYREILATDYSYLLYTDRAGKHLPGGLDAARAENEDTLKTFQKFKEYAARCLAEFSAPTT